MPIRMSASPCERGRARRRQRHRDRQRRPRAAERSRLPLPVRPASGRRRRHRPARGVGVAQIAPGDGIVVGVADMRIDVTHPDLVDQIDAPTLATSPQPGGCTAGAPVGPDDHGTHVAGTVAPRPRTASASPASPPRPRSRRCGRSTTAVTARCRRCIDAFDYAGDAAWTIVTAAFGTSPWLDMASKTRVNALIAAASPTTPKRSMWSPPATRETTTTRCPSIPATPGWPAKIQRTSSAWA